MLGFLILLFFGGALILFYCLVKAFFDSREALRRIQLLEKEVADLNKAMFQGASALLKKEEKTLPQPEIKKEIPKPAPIPPSSPQREIPTPKKAVPLPVTPKPQAPQKPAIDWEQFTGVKLFSWIGGFALFLGMVFFVKYSLDHGWISPWIRVIATFALGAGCVVGGLRMKTDQYRVTSQTLCAAGVAILYANTFAAHSVYHFMTAIPTFAFMTLVTFLSFLLAVRLDSKYIAILGLLGGFLTPPLLSTGVDRPFGLFGYITLLDAGLAAVALRKRWGFLVALSAVGTLLMMGGWTDRFFTVQKLGTGIAVFSLFPLFFAGVRGLAWKVKVESAWISRSAGLVPLLSLFFGWGLLSHLELGLRPGVVLGFTLALNTLLTLLVLKSDDFRLWHFLGGGVSFLILMTWTSRYISPDLLPWGLTFYLLFCVLHSAVPVLLQKFRPEATPLAFGHLYSLAMLLPFLIPILRDLAPSPLLWGILFLADGAILLGGLLTGAFGVVLGALCLSMGSMALWLHRMSGVANLPGLLFVLVLFGLAFFGVSLGWRRISGLLSRDIPKTSSFRSPAEMAACSALLPFLLLLMTLHQLPLSSPAPVFGCGFLFLILLSGIVVLQRVSALSTLTLIGASLPLFAWLNQRILHTPPEQTIPFLGWSAAYFLIFFLLPFAFRNKLQDFKEVWTVSAFSGPIYFYLSYKALAAQFGTALIGFLPAGFAGVFLIALIFLIRKIPNEHPLRQSQLALFGGVTLFFVSLIFPLQFEKEWITLGWALEAVCLLWLHRRVPHPGLKLWAFGLLILAFARLACNPAVFAYHAKTSQPILNWYLYAYGLTALCSIVAAKLWRPADQQWGGIRIATVWYSLGGILLFLLLNIEIADYFSAGATLTFRFQGGFAEDMSYTLGWAAFAFVLLLLGIRFRNAGARFTSLALILVAVLKLFFHDLWRLGQLYRVASFVGLALVLMLVSFLYQRFLSSSKTKPAGEESP